MFCADSVVPIEMVKDTGGNVKASFLVIFIVFQAFFQLPQCVGIIGGRPNHALYFCGIADNNVCHNY